MMLFLIPSRHPPVLDRPCNAVLRAPICAHPRFTIPSLPSSVRQIPLIQSHQIPRPIQVEQHRRIVDVDRATIDPRLPKDVPQRFIRPQTQNAIEQRRPNKRRMPRLPFTTRHRDVGRPDPRRQRAKNIRPHQRTIHRLKKNPIDPRPQSPHPRLNAPHPPPIRLRIQNAPRPHRSATTPIASA